MNEYISRKDALWIAFLTNASEETKERLQNWAAADVQPVDRWISVEDRLPENYIEVLVYDTDCGIVIGWYDKEIGDFVAEFISPLDAVTHWMPLPEPPKDGDAE
jgi:hypothetical protein